MSVRKCYMRKSRGALFENYKGDLILFGGWGN